MLIGFVSDTDLLDYKTICTAAEFTTHLVRKLDIREPILSPIFLIEKKVKIVSN